MDGPAHQLAEGGVHQAVTLQRAQAGEGRGNDLSFKVDAVVTEDADVGIRQAGLDQLADLFSIHAYSKT